MSLKSIVNRNIMIAALPEHTQRHCTRDMRGRFVKGNPYRFGKTAYGHIAQDVLYGSMFRRLW
jgi:hypothetical protein